MTMNRLNSDLKSIFLPRLIFRMLTLVINARLPSLEKRFTNDTSLLPQGYFIDIDSNIIKYSKYIIHP